MENKPKLIDTFHWMKLLPVIEKDNLYRLSREKDITTSHAYQIVKEFVRKGWVHCEKKGRSNKYTLTDKGKQVKETCDLVNQFVKE